MFLPSLFAALLSPFKLAKLMAFCTTLVGLSSPKDVPSSASIFVSSPPAAPPSTKFSIMLIVLVTAKEVTSIFVAAATLDRNELRVEEESCGRAARITAERARVEQGTRDRG